VADYPGMLHMASAVCVSPAFVDAYQRARIGRRWGFMPAQLGHTTYPSFKRTRGLRLRVSTHLPGERSCEPNEGLLRLRGTQTAIEAEALRSFFWEHGRDGHLKRDVWRPSCGAIRRTYAYRARPCRYLLSFVGWKASLSPRGVKRLDTYFVPASFVSEEEEKGLRLLEQWRLAVVPRVAE